MIHLCVQFNRLRSLGKQKRHARRCLTCLQALALEKARRHQLRSNIPMGSDQVLPHLHPGEASWPPGLENSTTEK